ncbi:hypothetical protein, partial [Klebsiella pneumoniae]|uniref:hypothetical protein n=1 Tax=Klebsiella pneumoniae TaxID=573 RepID=UPI001E2B7DA4
MKKFRSGIDVQDFSSSLHSTIDHHHQPHFISTEKFNQTVPEHIEYNGFMQIFAGGGSPTVDNNYTSHQVSSSGITVHHQFAKISQYSEYVPLST